MNGTLTTICVIAAGIVLGVIVLHLLNIGGF